MRATYQCGDTFTFNGTPPDNCPNHRWARIKSIWKVQTRAKYQCGDIFDFNGTPPDTCPNHWWARLESTSPIFKPQITATYQCGDTFDFNGTPPATCPNHGWAKIVSTWPWLKISTWKNTLDINLCVHVFLCPIETIIREKHQLLLTFATVVVVYNYEASIAVQQLIILCAILTTVCIMLVLYPTKMFSALTVGVDKPWIEAIKYIKWWSNIS